MVRAGRLTKPETLKVDVALLRMIVQGTQGSDVREAQLSTREVSDALEVSKFRARAAFDRLEAAGVISSHPCFDEKGGQEPNAVELTTMGEGLVAAMDAAASALLDDAYTEARRARRKG